MSKEEPKIAPRKAWQIGEMFGTERRQCHLALTASLGRGEREVMEQGGGIRVTRIDVIPDRRQPPRSQIAGRERSLSRARRTCDPYRSGCARLIELAEQPLAVDYAECSGPREFRKSDGRCSDAPSLEALR